jgi:hypothetical protein
MRAASFAFFVCAATSGFAARVAARRDDAPETTQVVVAWPELFPAVEGELMTTSSPGLAELNGDGALDIVFGAGMDRLRPENGRYVIAGEPAVPGYVVAVSGADNPELWRVPHPGDAFTTPRFADLDRDGVPDLVMGGRDSWTLGATAEAPDWRHLRWQLFRLDLDAAAPDRPSWGGFMGTDGDGRWQPESQPTTATRR